MTDSLLSGLILRLALVLAVVMGLVLWQIERTLDRTGDMAQDELLRRQAAEIVNNLSVQGGQRGGRLRVNLSPESAAAYSERGEGYVFYIQDVRGRMLAQSDPLASIWVQPALALRPHAPLFMSTEARDGESSALYLLIQPVAIQGGPLYVIVGQYRTIDDVLLKSAKAALMPDLLLVLGPLFLLGLVAAGLLVVQGLGPLRQLVQDMALASGRARQGFSSKIELADVPREVRPVVQVFNDMLQEFSKSLAAQQALSADTAHQLKTPLAVMQARLEQLPDFAGKADLSRDVQRMNRLVRQLLHYAVLAQHPAALAAHDLLPVVKDVVSGLVPLARQAGIQLEFSGPEQPILAQIDPLQVSEAVGNLVDNAIRHSPAKGTVEVTVSPAGEVLVADRGPGIPASEQALVFTRFWQGPTNQGTESPHGGAGLGLAVVAEIMRQHGGTAKVESRPGGGSIFTLGFSLAEPKAT